jgi:hypothetical protein
MLIQMYRLSTVSNELRFFGTPPNSAAGNYTVTYKAYDDFGGESFYPFNLEIK